MLDFSIIDTRRQAQQCKSCQLTQSPFLVHPMSVDPGTQQRFACKKSDPGTSRSDEFEPWCCSSSDISLKPLAGSSTRLMLEAHWPHSQKWAVSRCGFSSKGAEPSSLAAKEMETTSNWNSRPSAKAYKGRLQCSFTQRANIPILDRDLTVKILLFQYSTHCIFVIFGS